MQRYGLGARQFECGAKFFGQGPEVDDDSEIVEKSGQIGFTGIGIRNFTGEVTADQSASQRVFPEDDRIEASAVFGSQVENAAGHRDVADALKTKADDGRFERVNLLPSSEQGTIRHLQTLRGQRLVLRDHVGDFLNIELLHRLLQIAEQGSEHGRNGRNLLQSLNP